MKKRVHGEITVALCIVMSAVLMASYMLVEASRIAGFDYITEENLDTAGFSMLGNYDKQMLSQYGLFYIDGGFGRGEVDLSCMEDKLSEYLGPVENTGKELINDFHLLDYGVSDLEIISFDRITDSGCEEYVSQAADYIKDQIGINIIEGLMDGKLESLESTSKDIKEKRTEADSGIKELEDSSQEKEVSTVSKEENPIEVAKEFRTRDIMDLCLGSGVSISSNCAQTQDLMSKREKLLLESEKDLEVEDTSSFSLMEKGERAILFDEYLLDRFLCMSDLYEGVEDGRLMYELEYIYAGNSDDRSNLKSVIRALLAIREIANMAYLTTDELKKSEALALATTIAGITVNPVIIKAVQYGILLAWSFAESITDVRNLTQNRRVPFMKDNISWQVDSDMIVSAIKGEYVGVESESGLSYRDYLRFLLLTKSVENKALRSLDMMECNICSKEGYEQFNIYNCIGGFSCAVKYEADPLLWSNSFDYEYNKEKHFAYKDFGCWK